MFVDKINVKIRAGKGGNGSVSFRHEKFIERGGPDGGDGGNGGNIIARASNNQNTLADYRFKKEISAKAGDDGSKRKKHGKTAEELLLDLPVGTVITDSSGEILADLVADGQQQTIALGGKGGFGNAHFTSSIRQAPRIAEKGEFGEEFDAVFELKMIADVGLVGLPNAGKSTLLSRISNAHPEIANYPFTTLKPNLGVVELGKKDGFLVADIPGLIEGASKGKGLGDEFLRHIERTKMLIHIIDAYQEDIISSYKIIQKELAEYTVNLSKKPQLIAVNKIEGLDSEIVEDQIKKLKSIIKPKSTKIMAVSAVSGAGLKELLFETKNQLAKIVIKKESSKKTTLPVIKLTEKDDSWQVKKTKKGYVVAGKKIERFAAKTDFDNDEGISRLKDILVKMGIARELERKNIKPGQRIYFGDTANALWLDY